MDPRDHHDELFEAALERMLGLDRTDPADLADRLEKLLEADMDEMPARNESSQLRAAAQFYYQEKDLSGWRQVW